MHAAAQEQDEGECLFDWGLPEDVDHTPVPAAVVAPRGQGAARKTLGKGNGSDVARGPYGVPSKVADEEPAELYFRKAGRVANDYQPYTQSDYRRLQPANGQYW